MADPTTAIERVPVRLGLAPATIEEGWRLAQMMAKSELVPKAFRNKPEDVLVAIQMGAEVGFAPMQALQSIAVINGRPGVWGDGLLALIMSKPAYIDHDEYYTVNGDRRDGLVVEDLRADTTTAVCTFVRRGKATAVTRRFTIGQAKKAQLLGKEGPWQTYPDRMLAMRARSFAARDTFPDILRGLATAEELHDLPADIVRPIEPPRLVRRMSEGIPSGVDPVPTPEVVTLVGVQVERVDGNVVTLTDGAARVALTAAERDVADLVKLAGSGLAVTVTYTGTTINTIALTD